MARPAPLAPIPPHPPRPPPLAPPTRPESDDGSVITLKAPIDYEQDLMSSEDRSNAIMVDNFLSVVWTHIAHERHGYVSTQTLVGDAKQLLLFLKHHNLVSSDIKVNLVDELRRLNTAKEPDPTSSLILQCLMPSICVREVTKVALCTYALLIAVAGDDVHTEAPEVRSIIQAERDAIAKRNCTTPSAHTTSLFVKLFELQTFWQLYTRRGGDCFHWAVEATPRPSSSPYPTLAPGFDFGNDRSDHCLCTPNHLLPSKRGGGKKGDRARMGIMPNPHSLAVSRIGIQLLTGPYVQFCTSDVQTPDVAIPKKSSLKTKEWKIGKTTSSPPPLNSDRQPSPPPQIPIWSSLNPEAQGWLPNTGLKLRQLAAPGPQLNAPDDQVPEHQQNAPDIQSTTPDCQSSAPQGEQELMLSNPDGEVITPSDDESEAETMPSLIPLQPAPESTIPPRGNYLGCAACLETVDEEQRLCTLPCTHELHVVCAESWFCHANTCPVCRYTISTSSPGRLPTGEPRSLTFDTGAFLTNIVGDERYRACLRAMGVAGPLLHMSVSPPERMTARNAVAQGQEGSTRACSGQRQTNSTDDITTVRNARPSRTFNITIGNPRDGRAPICGQNVTPNGQNRGSRPLSSRRYQRRHNRGQSPSSPNQALGNFSMTPWARQGRASRRQPDSRAFAADNEGHAFEQVLAFALRIIAAILVAFMLVSLPSTKAEMIETLPPTKPISPAQISKFNIGDILVFESYPRSVSLALTSEEIDLSILFKLKSKLTDLSQYALNLAGNNLVPLAQAPGYCRPHGYASSLTQVLSSKLKFPHYVQIHEAMNSAEKVYVATLREDSKGARYCNYSLSYATKFSLTSVLDLGSSYYTVDRDQKYDIYRTWLTDRQGIACTDGLTVHRGEIAPQDTEFEMIIDHTDGSIFSCSSYCSNLNGLREQALRNAACILGDTCTPFAKSHCETFSFNWKYNRCRISSKASPVRDLATHSGWNSLVAFRECKALVQHQSAQILVNDSLHEISHVCRFSHTLDHLASSVYRSCPGIANGLQADITPLETTLDRYLISLEAVSKSGKEPANHSRPLESIGAKNRRAIHLAAIPATLTSLGPALESFLKIGTSHLSKGVGMKFLGNALPLANILLLTTNLIALAVGLATDLSPTIYHETIAELTELKPQKFNDWSLIKSPDLFKLYPLSEACKSEKDIKHNDAIPELLKEIGDSLKSLQIPLSRLIQNSAPLSVKVHEHISNEGGIVYGFWSTYYPARRALVRFFTYQVRGGPETMSRQSAILSGSSVAPVSEGTLIQGGSRKPGSLGPSWSCVEYIINAKNSSSWLPESCYEAPINPKPIHSTAFLPNAKIYRIFGKHRAEYSCPLSSHESIVSRGLLVLLVPNECIFTIDSMSMRAPDHSSTSAWPKPVRLVDRATEYEARKDAAYPKSLSRAISKLANDTLLPAITNINLQAGDTRKVQHQNDMGLTIAMCILGLVTFVTIFCMYRKLSQQNPWPFMTRQAFAARMRLPSRWTHNSEIPDGRAGNPTMDIAEANL